MIDLGELLGGDRNETEEQMSKVIEFEQRIANVRNNSDKASPRDVWNLSSNQKLFCRLYHEYLSLSLNFLNVRDLRKYKT